MALKYQSGWQNLKDTGFNEQLIWKPLSFFKEANEKKNSAIKEAGKLFLTALLISTWSCMWGGKEEKKLTIDLD